MLANNFTEAIAWGGRNLRSQVAVEAFLVRGDTNRPASIFRDRYADSESTPAVPVDRS
jgi:hypothetical protein